MTVTCDPCLGLGYRATPRHQFCVGQGCACSVCGHRGQPRDLPRAARPKPERVHVDIPADVAVRSGRFMTAAQVDWCFRLRDTGWGLREIGEALGGFGHPAVCVALQKRGQGRGEASS